ncbi:MAG: cobalamin B12-binding domain-containing protein, partial [Anaerolineales bacterium]|nr:cobalamin B12-binding domain-containing protein [Anaerolineales bacterium]
MERKSKTEKPDPTIGEPVHFTLNKTKNTGMKEIQRVLLISLPAVLEDVDTYLEDGHSFQLGLAYLASVLQTHGLEVTILDSYAEDRSNRRPDVDPGWLELGLSDEQILNRIDSAAPDLVGITVPFSCQHDLAVKLAAKIKARFPHVILVAGGNHISGYVDDEALDVFDYRILGEGEYALLELIRSLNQDEEVRTIAGVLQRGGSQSSRVPYIRDLDQLPF